MAFAIDPIPHRIVARESQRVVPGVKRIDQIEEDLGLKIVVFSLPTLLGSQDIDNLEHRPGDGSISSLVLE